MRICMKFLFLQCNWYKKNKSRIIGVFLVYILANSVLACLFKPFNIPKNNASRSLTFYFFRVKMVSRLVLAVCFLQFAFAVDIQRGPENPYAETSKCELIRIPACQGLPYNNTILPNIMGHTSQEEAGQDVTQYNSLVKIPCSPSLKLFLCSLYFPVCTQIHKPLPPCRSLCEQNRQRCEPIMRSFSFQVMFYCIILFI